MQTISLVVDGMRCESCAERIQSLLRRQHGVRKADVPFNERKASIRFDPQAITVDQLVTVIEEAGFCVAKRT